MRFKIINLKLFLIESVAFGIFYFLHLPHENKQAAKTI